MQNKNNLTFGLILILLSVGYYVFLFMSYKPKTIEPFGSETGVVKVDDQIFTQEVLQNLRGREVNGQLPVVVDSKDHNSNSPFEKVQ